MLASLAIVAGSSFILSWVLTYVVRESAKAIGCSKGPQSSRHIHKDPVPRIGGVALLLVFLISVRTVVPRVASSYMSAATWLGPILAIALVGLIDDLRGLRAGLKLAAQIFCAGYMFASGIRIPVPWFDGWVELITSVTLTIGWIVVVMNAVNLIDGLDALASGSATCSGIALLFAALRFRDLDSALLAALIVGALLGFLRFNVHPASIFLGDTGSLALGALLSVITVRLMQASPLAIVVSVLALAHPLIELVVSTVRRAITAKPLFRPDRRHLHHRLLDREYTHGQSSGALVAFSALFSFTAALASFGGIYAAVAVVFALIFGWYGFQVFAYEEFRYLAALPKRIIDFRFTVDAHVQLTDLTDSVEFCRHFGELETVLEGTFGELGFAGVELDIEGNSGYRESRHSRGVELNFPLSNWGERIGCLRLRWDLQAPPPLELDLFRQEFIPVLERTVAALLLSAEIGLVGPQRRSSGPVLVASNPARNRDTGQNYWAPVHN